jgi:hypothetical protein
MKYDKAILWYEKSAEHLRVGNGKFYVMQLIGFFISNLNVMYYISKIEIDLNIRYSIIDTYDN